MGKSVYNTTAHKILYVIVKIIGSFVIAKYQDGYAFIIEMKNDTMGLKVPLGDS